MRLILREYLSLLKEAGEIDALVPDLLLSMGVRPLSRPGSGPRQYGVDIPAVGIDPESSPRTRKLFLVTAKQGDINRADWNHPNDGVRDSLNEILDSYLANSVAPTERGLPVKVILATGGGLKPTVQPNWNGFTAQAIRTNHHGHAVEFDLWDGDRLANLLQLYLVDEYLFPQDFQATMRRTLALIGERDADLGPFEQLVGRTVESVPASRKRGDTRDRLKALRALRLAVGAMDRWGRGAGNTRPAMLAAEHLLLRTWGALDRHGLTHAASNEVAEVRHLLGLWRETTRAYVEAIAPACRIKDGLYGSSPAEGVEYPLRTFEVIGLFAVAGLDGLYQASSETGQQQTAARQRAADLSELIEEVVANNPAALHPPYDEHATELTLAVLLWAQTGRSTAAATYLRKLATRVSVAQQLGTSGVPLLHADYGRLTDLALGLRSPELPSSHVLLRLAELALVLGDDALCQHVLDEVVGAFPATHHLVWYPDVNTGLALYDGPGTGTGYTFAPVPWPRTPDGLRALVRDHLPDDDAPDYSADAKGFPSLTLMASRRFRTPLRPRLWRSLIR